MLTHLWRNRCKPRWHTIEGLKTWMKRVQQLPSLVRILWGQTWLRKRGADIHPFTTFSEPSSISGRLSLLTVGEGSLVGRAEIALHAGVAIGSNVCINDGVKILTGSHDVTAEDWPMIAKPIVIRDYAWVAVNAILLPGVTVGVGAVVGAGAVITKDVPDFHIAVGNPAKLLSHTRPSRLSYHPLRHHATVSAWLGTVARSQQQHQTG